MSPCCAQRSRVPSATRRGTRHLTRSPAQSVTRSTRSDLPTPATDRRRRAQGAAAYPVYRVGYEAAFATVDEWASTLPRVLHFGRQGLFAHDNTHHALAMAWAAADAIGTDGLVDEHAMGHRARPLRHPRRRRLTRTRALPLDIGEPLSADCVPQVSRTRFICGTQRCSRFIKPSVLVTNSPAC